MKKYIKSNSDDLERSCDFEYGYYNDIAKDREYFTKQYENRGYTDVKVKRVATDTPGLKMYEISYIKSSTNITADFELSTAMEEMIECIANEWKQDMEDQDCETFKEFCRLNDYEASDIREELRYMIQHHYNGWMYDDGSVVIAIDDTEMPYGKFKKAVIDKIKDAE